MIKIIKGRCSKRPGVVERKPPGEDEWVPVAYTPDGDTYVCGCEHEAAEIMLAIIDRVIELIMEGKASGDAMPSPSEFRYTHVDQEPAEIEVGDVSDAVCVINAIKEMKS